MPAVGPGPGGRAGECVAKALDEHRELFQLQLEPWYYDPRTAASSTVNPLHPGRRASTAGDQREEAWNGSAILNSLRGSSVGR